MMNYVIGPVGPKFSPAVSKELTYLITIFTEGVVQRCSVKREFLKLPQNFSESTCNRVYF